MSRLQSFATTEAMAEAAAAEVTRIAAEAVARRGTFLLVLAGGSTPRFLYEKLSADPYRSQIDWSSVQLFWGDERCVPPHNPASNYAMALETLLFRVPVADRSVHRIQGELEPARAAQLYENELCRVTGETLPEFDLVLLGVGTDGHTASLFPDTLDLLNEQRLVITTVSPHPPRHRVTLTLKVLNAARAVMFLVQGGDKARVLRDVMAPDDAASPSPLPAALVRPREGRPLWFIDRAAAAEIPERQRI